MEIVALGSCLLIWERPVHTEQEILSRLAAQATVRPRLGEYVMPMIRVKSDKVSVYKTLKIAKPEPFRAAFHILQHSLYPQKAMFISHNLEILFPPINHQVVLSISPALAYVGRKRSRMQRFLSNKICCSERNPPAEEKEGGVFLWVPGA
jgi:hypothetical protein